MLGVFTRRQIISSLIPVFFCVTMVVGIVLLAVDAEYSWWAGMKAEEQVVIGLSYVLMVVFLAVVALGLQDAVERIFQGSLLPTFRLARWIPNTLILQQERAHAGMRMCYQEAKEVQNYLKEFEVRIRDLDATPGNSGNESEQCRTARWNALSSSVGALLGTIDSMKKTLEKIDPPLSSPKARPLPEGLDALDGAINKVGRDARNVLSLGPVHRVDRATRTIGNPDRVQIASADAFHGEIGCCSQRMADIAAIWAKKTGRYRERYLFGSPTRQGSVGPTILSNIFGSMDEHPYRLYGIDAASMWSRLQPLAPAELLDPLRDAKASMDQMLSLAALTVLSGLAVSPVLALRLDLDHTPHHLPYLMEVGFGLGVLALFVSLGSKFRLHRYFRKASGIRPNCLEICFQIFPPLVASAACLTLGLGVFGKVALPGAAFRVSLGVAIAAFSMTLAYMFYWNSLFAAAGYAEKVCATFDLYRWRVLDEMGFSRPQNLRDEWKLWEHFRELVFSDGFDARQFMYRPRIIAAEGEVDDVLVPAETIVRGRKVGKDNLRTAKIRSALLPEKPVGIRGLDDVDGMRALTSLSRGQAISRNLLCEEGEKRIEIVVQAETNPSFAGWMIQEGDQVLVGRAGFAQRLLMLGHVGGVVCQVNPYKEEERRLYGRRYVGEAEYPIAVSIKKRALWRISHLAPEDRVIIGRLFTHHDPEPGTEPPDPSGGSLP
jgi:hypothetical protein